MSSRLIILLLIFSFYSNAQTIDSVFKKISYIELNISLIHNLDSLVKISTKQEENYIGFSNSKYFEKVIFDKKNDLFLFPTFYRDSIFISFNIYSKNGVPLASWEFISNVFCCHHIVYYQKKKYVTKKSIIVGCPKGKRCRFYKFNRQLFSGLTMNKLEIEFNQMIYEIMRQHPIKEFKMTPTKQN
jgi:hypothetical protein